MAYEIEVKDLPARPVASIRLTIAADRMGPTFMEVLPEVFAYLQKEGIEPAGPTFGIFYSYGDEVDMEVGLPVPQPVSGEGRVVGRTLEPGTFAVTWHHGSYRSIGEAHRAVEGWIKENGHQVAGPPWEVYWTGPASGKDTSEYVTEVGYPMG